MKRRFFLILSAAILLALGWYFLIKEGEFEVRFKAKTLPGDLIQTLAIWNKSLQPSHQLEIDSLSSVIQQITIGDRSYRYQWNFRQEDDSTTLVEAVISQPDRSFLNKLLVPFTRQQIEEDAEQQVRTFYKITQEHLDITRVSVMGLDSVDSRFCICIPLKTRQTDKANGMMKTYNYLVDYIEKNNLEVAGKPSIDILSWSHNEGTLEYDFCFPILPSDTLPADPSFYYKSILGTRAIKAVYNGNYITSDRAWYYLYQYARDNQLKIKGFPLEVFYNNPNMGLNESLWKAEVFLPVE